MEPLRSELPSPTDKVISPFADSEAVVSQRKTGAPKVLIIGSVCLVLIAAGVVGGMFITRYLNDPYRTLEIFSVSKYLDNYKAVAGSKFKAEFRVEADLGWKDGTGRLMLFSTADDARPIAVLVPASVANGIYFTKGQTYIAEVEVKEGGLIYANSCKKN